MKLLINLMKVSNLRKDVSDLTAGSSLAQKVPEIDYNSAKLQFIEMH